MIRSVKFKLAGFITVLVILAGGLLEWFHYQRALELMTEAAARRGETAAENLAYNAYLGVSARQGGMIAPLVEGAMKDPDVLFVRVVAFVDGAGGSESKENRTIDVLLSKASEQAKDISLDELTRAVFDADGELSADVERQGVRFLHFSTPVEAAEESDMSGLGMFDSGSSGSGEKQRYGFVQVGYSYEPVHAQAWTFLTRAVALLLVVSGTGLVIGLWIASGFVRPLSAIVEESRRIAQGDLSQILERDADRRDETGELVRSFNQMVLELRRSRAELDEYSGNLAKKVDERTREVEKAYADLKSSQEAQTDYSEVLRAFNETADVDGVLREGLQGMTRFTGAVLGAVHIWDEGDLQFHASATQGIPRQALASFHMGEGFAGRAAEERKMLVIREIPEETRWIVKNIGGEVLPSEILAAPIVFRDEVLGVLELCTLKSGFGAQRQRLLEDLIGQFAIALSNVIANERTRQLAQTLQAKGRELEQQNRTLSEQSNALQRQQAELDEKNKDLQRASRLKSEFLANMSHELRTPMNSIIGYTDLVLNRAGDALDSRHRKNLDKVLANAQHLLSLINGILDLSKIEAGKMELYLEEFELQPLLESTAAMAEVLIKAKPVTLVQRIQPSLPPLKTDKTKLRQIILNLLSNACKFTESGEVTLIAEEIVGRRGNDSGALLKIEVTDSGIGMEEKDLAIIFEEFRQVDGSSTRKYGGTGLGLAIVKKMVTLMGGEIRVGSVVGKGSTFTVVLPLETLVAENSAIRPEAVEAEGRVTAQRSADRGVLRAESAAAGLDDEAGRKVILVVDDEPDSVILVRENLGGQPFRVIGAFSAAEGMRMALKAKPFAILLDVMMPETDGWEFMRQLKAEPGTRDIPVVILSIVDNKPLGFSLGVTDYLLKPIDRDALVQTLTRISGRPIHKVMVVDDDEGVRDVLDHMLKREGYEVTLAKNGVEAIAALDESTPDLLVLDLMMPEMDGFEVVRRIRSNAAWANLPIVICTAKDLTESERSGLQATVSQIVQKGSMQQDVLMGELGNALRNLEQQLAANGDAPADKKKIASA